MTPIETIRFGELFAEPTRNGLTRPKSVRGSGVKMVNMGELFAHPRLRCAQMDRVPLSEAEHEKCLLNGGDLLFARQSLVVEGAGKCSIFLNDDEPVTFESHLTRVRLDANKADPLFYFYYLNSPHGRAAIRSIVEQGAGASGIRGSDLKTLEVHWRPVAEQKFVSHILGTLDDKIELNRKMSETLEAIASALFKSWFIDFNPADANSASKQAGSKSSDSFLDESELGPAPDGWVVVKIEELADIAGGSTPSTREPTYWNAGRHAFATPKDLSELRTSVLLGTSRLITDDGLKRIGSGLMPPGTVLLSSRAPIGYLAINEIPVAINQGFIAMKPKPSVSNLFLLYWAKAAHWQIVSRANGSTFLEISKRAFRSIPLMAPPDSVMNEFDRAVRPIHDRIVLNERQTVTLGELRDALLPKLISGELPINDAVDQIEAAA